MSLIPGCNFSLDSNYSTRNSMKIAISLRQVHERIQEEFPPSDGATEIRPIPWGSMRCFKELKRTWNYWGHQPSIKFLSSSHGIGERASEAHMGMIFFSLSFSVKSCTGSGLAMRLRWRPDLIGFCAHRCLRLIKQLHFLSFNMVDKWDSDTKETFHKKHFWSAITNIAVYF